MSRGIVFFDYDGTLVDESRRIYRPTAATMSAVEELRKNGYLAVLATGRAKCYIPDTGIEWDGMITSNGACAEINGKRVYNRLVSDELVNELVEKADSIGYKYVLENQEICYTNGLDNKHFIETLKFFDIRSEHFHPVSEAEKLTANKMFLTYESPEVFERLEAEFKGRFVFGQHRHNLSCDVDVEGNSKGLGIAEIAAQAEVDMKDTYAFGDSINDYEMLRNVAHGIAMGEHREELLKVCEFVTETVDKDGVARGLAKLGLISSDI